MTGRDRRILNKSAEDWLEEYDEMMITELLNQLDGISVEDSREIFDKWHETLPEPGQWASEMAYAEYEDYMDSKRDLELDR